MAMNPMPHGDSVVGVTRTPSRSRSPLRFKLELRFQRRLNRGAGVHFRKQQFGQCLNV